MAKGGWALPLSAFLQLQETQMCTGTTVYYFPFDDVQLVSLFSLHQGVLL